MTWDLMVQELGLIWGGDGEPWHSMCFGTTFPMILKYTADFMSIMGNLVSKHLGYQGSKSLV